MRPYTCLTAEVHNRIARITLDRPEKRNALNDVLVSELKTALQAAGEDPGVKVVILRARGAAFCAGADLEYLQRLQQFSFEENLADSQGLMHLFQMIYHLPKIVIAQVEGPALAGGCGLVTVCDFAFATPEATFGYTEARIGFVPAIVMAFLLRKVGETRTKELMLSAGIIDAAQAEAYHLINQVVAVDEISTFVETFAEGLCTRTSGQSLALTKQLLADIQDLSLSQALDLAARTNAQARGTADCQRGIAAFLQKQPLTW